MFAVLFICSIALCIVTGLAYFKLENKDFAKASDAVADLGGTVTAVESLQKTALDQQKNFQSNTTQALQTMNERIDKMENDPRNINFNIKEPIKFQVVYRDAKSKLPNVPPQISGKDLPPTKSLLKRAGLLSREINQ